MTSGIVTATSPVPRPDAHRHRWTGVDFVVVDDHPVVRQTCDCGVERRIRAFERFWDPVADAPGGPRDSHR